MPAKPPAGEALTRLNPKLSDSGATRLNPTLAPEAATRFNPNVADVAQTRLNPVIAGVKPNQGRAAPEDACGTAMAHQEWRPGTLLLELYEVKEMLGAGGFGFVHRVLHRSWKKELAVKSPRPDSVAAVGGVENFAAEAETWVGLGLHPHIVNCYYVRRIESVPCIFMEYVNGGSLEQAILQRTLYQGTAKEVIARMLDFAIQFAWGLHFAHEQGLVHQDVKPANAMLSGDGIVKVTDFGLANASHVGENMAGEADGTMMINGCGMTPAYAAPEQIEQAPLTRRTDLWGWGVSVLEMFAGQRYWQSGSEAMQILQQLGTSQVSGIPPMPSALGKLLDRCFRIDPAQRPHDLSEVADELQQIYQQLSGKAYPRNMPALSQDTAERLNNRALSLLDLGHSEEAYALWHSALEKDPHHLESVYNHGLLQWRKGQSTDLELVSALQEAIRFYRGTWLHYYFLAGIHLERGDCPAAAQALDKIPPEQGETERINEARQHCQKAKNRAFKVAAHKARITFLALGGNGKYLLSGDANGYIQLRRLSGFQTLCSYQTHRGAVVAAVFDERRKRIISAGQDDTLQWWDTEQNECVQIIPAEQGSLDHLLLSRDRRVLLSANKKGEVKLWKAVQTQHLPLRHFNLNQFPVVLAFFDNYKHLLVLSDNGDLGVWDPMRQGNLKQLRTSRKAFGCCVTGSGGQLLLLMVLQMGERHYRFNIWDAAAGHHREGFDCHSIEPKLAALSHDGQWILSAEAEGLVRLWNSHQKRCVYSRRLHCKITALLFRHDGRGFYAATKQGELHYYPLPAIKQPYSAILSMSQMSSVDSLFEYERNYRNYLQQAQQSVQKGDYAGAVSHARLARMQPGYARDTAIIDLWLRLYLKLGKKALRGAWEKNTGLRYAVPPAILHVRGDYLIAAGHAGSVDVYTYRDMHKLDNRYDDGGHAPVNAAVPDMRGVSLVVARAAGKNGKSKKNSGPVLWQIKPEKALHRYGDKDTAASPATAVDFSPDAQIIASAHENRLIKLWTFVSGVCLRTLDGHTDRIGHLLFTPDGDGLISAGDDNVIKFWDIPGAACLETIPAHNNGIAALVLTPCGRFLFSGGGDGWLKIWDTQSTECLHEIKLKAPLTALACSADGLFVLSATARGDLQLWETDSGQCLHKFKAYTEKITALSISGDNSHIFVAYADGNLRCWVVDWDLEEHLPHQWEEEIEPYLQAFYWRNIPRRLSPAHIRQGGNDVEAAFKRLNKPAQWQASELSGLLQTLAGAGYGWLSRNQIEQALLNWQEQLKREQTAQRMEDLMQSTGLARFSKFYTQLRDNCKEQLGKWRKPE